MRVGLLLADRVDPDLLMLDGDLLAMYRRFMHGSAIDPFRCYDGELPASSYHCDLFLITGSRHSVNDDVRWIRKLEDLIRLRSRNVPFVGICFGHQVLASALGGQVRRSEHGWHVGMEAVGIVEQPEWMDGPPSAAWLFNHREEVVSLPIGGRLLARSSRCSVQMFVVGDSVLGIQGHPEYSIGYQEALMRRNLELSASEREHAFVANRSLPLSATQTRHWIANFARSSRKGAREEHQGRHI